METRAYMTQQRNQHYSGTCSNCSGISGSGSGSGGGGDSGGCGCGGGGFSEIGCPMVECEVGLLPSPSNSYGSPSLNRALSRTPCGYNGQKSVVADDDDAMESKKGVMGFPVGVNFETNTLFRAPCGYNGGKWMVVDDAMESKKDVMSSPVGVNFKRSALLQSPCGYNGGISLVDDGAMESKMGVMSSPLSVNLERSYLSRTPCGYNVGNSVVRGEAMESKKGVINSPMSVNLEGSGMRMNKSKNGLLLSERWAGPTYSSSPPPSCLPMPKFSVNQKRSVSLEFPSLKSGSGSQMMVKSAPASPRGDSSRKLISSLVDDDSATKSLCRILNLDISDD